MALALTWFSSTAAQADPGTVPAAPTAVSAVAGYQSAELTWTVGSDGGETITDFVVTIYVDAVEQSTVDVPATGPVTNSRPGALDNYTVVLVTGGSGYTFTVAAENDNGMGPESAPSNSVDPSSTPTAPYPPSFPTATAGSHRHHRPVGRLAR